MGSALLLDVAVDGVDGGGRGPCKAGGQDMRAKFGLMPFFKTGILDGSSKSSIPEGKERKKDYT